MTFNRKVGEPPNPDRDEPPWTTKLYQWMKDAADAINNVDLGGQTTVVQPPAKATPGQQITITVPGSGTDGETVTGTDTTLDAKQTVVRFFSHHLWSPYEDDDDNTWTDNYVQSDNNAGHSQLYMALPLPIGCTVLKIECMCDKQSASSIDFTWAQHAWASGLSGSLATKSTTAVGVHVVTIYSGAKVINDLGSYYLIGDIGDANRTRLYDVKVTFTVDDLEDYL